MKRINTNPHIESKILKRNKHFPNSRLPVLLYRQALLLPDQKNRAAAFIQKIFLRHHWGNSWRNGVYDFHHYHSITHEVLGIAAGRARIIFGGPGKRSVEVHKGDAIIIPAGVGHKCVEATAGFLCVGAYPGGKEYDTLLGTAGEYAKAVNRIRKLPLPKNDPVFGSEGFLKSYWKPV